MSAQETAICVAMDAMRICLGIKPKNFSPRQVIRWMLLMKRS